MRALNLPGLIAVMAMAALPALSVGQESSIHSESEPDPRRCSAQELDNCLNGVGGGVTSLDNLRVNAAVPRNREKEEQVERAQGVARYGLGKGTAAGEGTLGDFGMWASGNLATYESTVRIAPYDGNTWNWMGGIDRTFSDSFLLGATMGYEITDTDTFYNGGGQKRTGFSMGGYGAYLINDIFSVDVIGGYSWLNNDETRLATNNGATLLGSYNSYRYFVASNLNAVYTKDSWVFGGRVGLLYTKESQDSYTETGASTQARSIGDRDVDLTQFSIGGDIGYSIGAVEPYALAIYRNDLSSDDGASAGGLPAGVRPQPDDDDDFQFGFGVRYFGADGVTGFVEWLHTEGRDNFREDQFNVTVRFPL